MFSKKIDPPENEYDIYFSVSALVCEISAIYKHPFFESNIFFNNFADNYAAKDTTSSYFS